MGVVGECGLNLWEFISIRLQVGHSVKTLATTSTRSIATCYLSNAFIWSSKHTRGQEHHEDLLVDRYLGNTIIGR